MRNLAGQVYLLMEHYSLGLQIVKGLNAHINFHFSQENKYFEHNKIQRKLYEIKSINVFLTNTIETEIFYKKVLNL